MKKITVFLFSIFCSMSLLAQDVTGDWNGILNVQGTQLRLIIHITKTADGYSSTLDSPDQGANGIPASATTFENNELTFEISSLKATYKGTLEDGKINGTFSQMGYDFDLVLSREEAKKVALDRPQEPKAPFSYHTEEVKFSNKKANIELAGTFTKPKGKGKFPVVILISGSGPQDRNEELMGHKPFLVLADHLTKNGIAVLRYDDRGFGESTGVHSGATSADLATDVEAAIAYLKTRKDIKKKKIGLVGHSEGGLIAPMVAANNKSVAFIVSLAGPGTKGHELLLQQTQLIGKASGMSDDELQTANNINSTIYDIILKNDNPIAIQKQVRAFFEENKEGYINSQKPEGMSDEDFMNILIAQTTSPWMVYFIKYDPIPYIEQVKCPVLAINGGKDLQVPAEENINGFKTALAKGGNKKVTTKIFPNLNHLFQECETGSPSEYSKITQTFAPVALEEVSQWILKIVK